jgi:uncharacterized repeat protein (TIGR01451 family)
MMIMYTSLYNQIRLAAILALCLAGFYLNAQTTATVSGRITNVQGDSLNKVAIVVSGTVNKVVFTDNNGYYHVSLPLGGAYSIRPYSDVLLLNGVSTFDFVKITTHALHTDTLKTPYQLIAADLNHDGVINISDTIGIRNIILGIWNHFPYNTSLRFVRSNYQFPDPTNPFVPPFPEAWNTGSLDSDVNQIDFFAIKIGDVSPPGSGVASYIPNGGNSWNWADTLYLSNLKGRVSVDQNANCLSDNQEPGLSGWHITATSATDTLVARTDDQGNYAIWMPPGTYQTRLNKPNDLWSICVDSVGGVQLNPSDSARVDFSAQPIGNCPFMNVEMSGGLLRRCWDNQVHVFYSNQGTESASDVRITIDFDPLISVTSSSLPWSSVSGHTYTFPIGQVASGASRSFLVSTVLSCDAVAGQTICNEAHIYPDSVCGPMDSLAGGSQLKINGHCQNGSVVFTITNDGTDMTEPASYVVIEDIMIQMTGNDLQLQHGQAQTLTFPANGNTWRLEVNQPNGSPWYYPAAGFLEGCGTNGSGTFSTGFINKFPLGDQSPFVDADCRKVVASFDPNEKSAFPQGADDAHWLKKDQEIDYQIDFQNTGTDTAFLVVVLDTLSNLLNPATIRPLGGSHPFTFHVLGSGVVQFVMAHILLPDSSVNEPASHGYVRFAVKPKAGAKDGALVFNKAAIYFDFNTPVITNTVYHTLGTKFLQVSTIDLRLGLALEVYPNPVSGYVTFFLQSVLPVHGTVRIFNAEGLEIASRPVTENKFGFDTAAMPAGVYFFRMEGPDGQIGAGRFVVVRE